jgi:hypothetical protein
MSPISKTRSGKSYGLQEQKIQKKARCCSYCCKSGHNISRCKDQSLYNLEKKARAASIFGDCIVDGTSKFLKVWLNTLTNTELRALGYRFYSMEKFKLKYNGERETYIYNLASEFSWDELPWPLPEKLNHISEETFCEFNELLLANTHEIWHDYFKEVIVKCRPNARRFDIEANFNRAKKSKGKSCPICLSDKIKSKNIVTTNCNHEYCGDCFAEYLQSVKEDITKTPTCACCREKISTIDVRDKAVHTNYKKEFCRAPLKRAEEPILTPSVTYMNPSQLSNQNQNQNQNLIATAVYYFISVIPA